MIAYASYLPKKTDLVKNAFLTSIANCGYSFFAGFAVFSVLGYMATQKGVAIPDVIKSGPTLAFVVYPEAISRLPMMNSLFGFIFFLALVIAGLSSGISIIEAISSAILDKFSKIHKINRKKVVSSLCVAGFLGSLLFTVEGGLYFLDIVDHFLTQYGLVVAGLLECLIVGWILKVSVLRRHINAVSVWKINKIWDFLIRYFIPVILAVMVIQSIFSDVGTPYEGYPTQALLLLGVGWVVITILLAVVITLPAWEPEKLAYEHIPEEEHLLL
jgi:NSS family neurotransmitter:Na+ symporter